MSRNARSDSADPQVRPAGLYDPSFEADACGVGFVADVSGNTSHDIIRMGLRVLRNLAHRGACGSDPCTGDGAGLLIQLPHRFFKRVCEPLAIPLPEPGHYGAGLVFLPTDRAERELCMRTLEEIIAEEGQVLLGWRDVPTDRRKIGAIARQTEPAMMQVFIGRGKGFSDAEYLERKLYVIRKLAERRMRESGLAQKKLFYICSLSHRTLVYKGQLMSEQLGEYFLDLRDPELQSALAIVHSRFSTNTFPSWELAHPFRYLAHNGEINTLRGNLNWMSARERQFVSELFGEDIKKIIPVIEPGGSDSAALDNVVEMLTLCGRSVPHALMMLIPEAWGNDTRMDPNKRAFYEFHACMNEPWDGPAAIVFTNGIQIGATLDRNGLRPARYVMTKGGLIVLASEVGVLDFAPEEIRLKGRLQPGRMLLVDTEQGRIIEDEELKRRISTRRPYRQWLEDNRIDLAQLPDPPFGPPPDHETVLHRQQAFGYTAEDIDLLLIPMARDGQEPVGSMGNDAPLAVLSNRPVLLYNYFKQLFAQVTNPPIDSIREELVMSLTDYIGRTRNLLDETPEHCHQVKIPHPVLSNRDLEKLRHVAVGRMSGATLPMLFPAGSGGAGLERALEALCAAASRAVAEGANLLVLSDRGVGPEQAPIPALLAVSAIHKHLVREGLRGKCGLIVESGEVREVMHFALLIGYGASAVNPYLVYETLADLRPQGRLPDDLDLSGAEKRYAKAMGKGLLKTFAKMGISTLRSYRGAQLFEAVGLSRALVDRYFTGTVSRLEGIGLAEIAAEVEMRHRDAFSSRLPHRRDLDPGGQYRYRRNGEFHQVNPDMIALLQAAVRSDDYKTYKQFSALVDDQSRNLATLRGLLEFKRRAGVPIEQVEPETEIVKRFATGAMSFGSISKEAHENLARAMNRLGGKSNTGEGGEDPERFRDDRRSKIKQVASARFGVTMHYLVNSDELQIKISQGAKPGEGGQLPGHKVDAFIAKIRHSTPGVTLISPPPHHDIYSIEDLAQLIYDLKNANPKARISVKLVSEVGVGTVAAGVAKAHADLVLISGHDGGTGASPLSSIKHAGLPWELGLAETQQVLVMNNLRGRIRVQTDGQLKTGRDVAIAALLGAEEFGFSTMPLVASGCVMMRKCHTNTCPVGIATQDPELRKRFAGKPDHVIHYFMFVARELREIMAELGFRTVDEMVGRADRLEVRPAVDHWKARGLDLSPLLAVKLGSAPNFPAEASQIGSPSGKLGADPNFPLRCVESQNHELEAALDWLLLPRVEDALEKKQPCQVVFPIRNTHRTVGTIIAGEITRRYGPEGLPDDTITLRFTGSAGQSFGAFATRGLTLILEGDANDYAGKGLSGGKLIMMPPKGSTFIPRENILVGNVVLYGATSGEAYFRGMAGERFAVRNSGAYAVVEGVGDHGCEYMTGGVVVVLGKTGRNFAAGMSGGLAYVMDYDGDFAAHCNMDMIELASVTEEEDVARLRTMLERHRDLAGSAQAAEILDHWKMMLSKFVKVIPIEYRRVMEERKRDPEYAAKGM